MANGENGSKFHEKTWVPVSVVLIVGAFIWYTATSLTAAKKDREHAAAEVLKLVAVSGELQKSVTALEHTTSELSKLEEKLERLERAQIRWDAKLKEASDESHRAISRADEARVDAGVNDKRLTRLESQ